MIKILRHCLPVLLLALTLVSCNQEDDVDAIFVGRTWYVVNLNSAKGETALSKEQWTKLYSNPDDYYIKFTSLNTFTVTISSGDSYSGDCVINGDKHTISFNMSNASSNDAIGKKMISWMKNTTTYYGDANVLELRQEDSSNFIALAKSRGAQ